MKYIATFLFTSLQRNKCAAVTIQFHTWVNPKTIYRRPLAWRLKHFSLVWQSLCPTISVNVLRGPFGNSWGTFLWKLRSGGSLQSSPMVSPVWMVAFFFFFFFGGDMLLFLCLFSFIQYITEHGWITSHNIWWGLGWLTFMSGISGFF